MRTLEALFAPAEFGTLGQRDLSGTVCVVFDVLRATSSMVTALANGATAVIPVSEISEALDLRKRDPEILLAGERDGLRIGKQFTGSIDFDLGNSPREFIKEVVAGRKIVMTTTNGTRALRACAGAKTVLVASFLNIGATVAFLERLKPENLLLICSGTFEQTAYEDVLGAGAVCELLWNQYRDQKVADAAQIARQLFLLERGGLPNALAHSRNGQRLMGRTELRDDVAFCAQLDTQILVAEMGKQGMVTRKTG